MIRSLHTLADRIGRDTRSLLAAKKLDTGTIVLRWDAAAAPADRNVPGDYPAPDPQSEEVNAFIHWVSMRAIQSGVTMFKAGDVIVSFDRAQDLTQRGLVFELPDGKIYVQAATGHEVNEFWDVHVGGVPLLRTLLLRLRS